MKKGFSLLEMLVVIGMIGILAGVLLSTFGGATESAKAAQCMNNMRSLAVGAINAATANSDGVFPGATPWKQGHMGPGKVTYSTHAGWISWIGGRGTSKSAGSIPTAGGSDYNNMMYALTNGALWKAVGASRECYTCPVHKRAFEKKNKGRGPWWSYVMNEEFGYSSEEKGATKGKQAYQMRLTSKKTSDGRTPAADKILMFAEMQGIDIDDKNYPAIRADYSGTGEGADPILRWRRNEQIGFNHVAPGSKNQKYAGHVAFADGHVSKIYLPKDTSVGTLTEWLCLGYDVTFSGTRYEKVQ